MFCFKRRHIVKKRIFMHFVNICQLIVYFTLSHLSLQIFERVFRQAYLSIYFGDLCLVSVCLVLNPRNIRKIPENY